MVPERGHAQENVGCSEQSAAHATEYVAKAGIELRGIRDGVFAPMDTNLNPVANTGEPKVFYNKTNGESYRFLEEPVALQRQAPMIQKVLKTIEFPQVQYVDEIVDEPVVMQGQVPTAQTGQRTVDMSQVQFPDRVADVPVVSRRHVPGQPIREEIVEAIRVVNSDDVPLNIYRGILLENKILCVIKKHVTKCLEMLAEIAELRDAYKEFHEQLVKCMKLGIDEDSTVGVKTAEVLRFNTSKSGDKRINFKEYVYYMTQEQNDVYHIPGESIAMMSSPFEENLHKKGPEEFHVAEPMDEYAVYQFKESDGTKLNPTTKEGLNFGDENEEKTPEELKSKLKPSMKLMKDVLGDKAEMVIEGLNADFEPLTKLMKHILVDKSEKAMVSDRIVDSPCVLTTSEYGWSAKMERIMEAQALRDNSITSHMVSKKTTEVNPTHSIMMELKSQQDLHGYRQQQQDQLTKQSTRQERGGERKKERNREGKRGRSEQEEERDQEGRKEEERRVEERGSEQVKKDVTDWTVVTRKKKRKMVQIFVKADGSRATPMEENLSDDKVEDILRQVQNDEDAYVTLHGRVLKRGEKLKSCGVTDGCTVQVTSRLRGGGKHKDKRGQKEKKRAAKPKGPEQDSKEEPMSDERLAHRECNQDEVFRMTEANEEFQKMIMEGSDSEVEERIQYYLTTFQEWMRWEEERMEEFEERIRRMVEERRRGKVSGKAKQGQNARQELSKQEKRVRVGDEEQSEETRAESTDEPEVTGRLVEVRTGPGSAGLVRGGDERHLADESSRKGKGKGNGEKASMKAKEEREAKEHNRSSRSRTQ